MLLCLYCYSLKKPLHSFDCLCLKLKLVSCPLACCIGSTTTAADSIATAASTATITNVEFILSSFECLLILYLLKKNKAEFLLLIYME